VRILDSLLAVSERLIAQSPDIYNASNVYLLLAYDYWGDNAYTPSPDFFPNFFRNERLSLLNI
jgi:hypothetical protein